MVVVCRLLLLVVVLDGCWCVLCVAVVFLLGVVVHVLLLMYCRCLLCVVCGFLVCVVGVM